MAFQSWDVHLPGRSEKFIRRVAKNSIKLALRREKKWKAGPTARNPYRLLCPIPWSWQFFSGAFFSLEIILIPLDGKIRIQVGRPLLRLPDQEIGAIAQRMVVYVRRVCLRAR